MCTYKQEDTVLGGHVNQIPSHWELWAGPLELCQGTSTSMWRVQRKACVSDGIGALPGSSFPLLEKGVYVVWLLVQSRNNEWPPAVLVCGWVPGLKLLLKCH